MVTDTQSGFRPPDLPLWTWDQAGSASLRIALRLISRYSNPVYLHSIPQKQLTWVVMYTGGRHSLDLHANLVQAKGGVIFAVAIPRMQATVAPVQLLECCVLCSVLCNIQLNTTSTGKDHMNHTKTFIQHNGCSQWCWRYYMGVKVRLVGFVSVPAKHWLYLWANVAPVCCVGLICQCHTSNSDVTQIIPFSIPALLFLKVSCSVWQNLFNPEGSELHVKRQR